MSTLTRTRTLAEPVDVAVTDDTLRVELSDGRSISAPLAWFPRLLHGTPKERANFELGGFGIHWPDLDEDIPVEGLLLGEKSSESMTSLKRWLDYRAQGKRIPVPTFPLPADMARMLEKLPAKKTATGRRKAK